MGICVEGGGGGSGGGGSGGGGGGGGGFDEKRGDSGSGVGGAGNGGGCGTVVRGGRGSGFVDIGGGNGADGGDGRRDSWGVDKGGGSDIDGGGGGGGGGRQDDADGNGSTDGGVGSARERVESETGVCSKPLDFGCKVDRIAESVEKTDGGSGGFGSCLRSEETEGVEGEPERSVRPRLGFDTLVDAADNGGGGWAGRGKTGGGVGRARLEEGEVCESCGRLDESKPSEITFALVATSELPVRSTGLAVEAEVSHC